jgi:hypothetical protein
MATDVVEFDEHLFAVLDASLSKQRIAEHFGLEGWSVRKCSWFDYEVRGPWAELVLEGESEVLLHGPIANAHVHANEILSPLRTAGVGFKAEFYDAKHTILFEVVE